MPKMEESTWIPDFPSSTVLSSSLTHHISSSFKLHPKSTHSSASPMPPSRTNTSPLGAFLVEPHNRAPASKISHLQPEQCSKCIHQITPYPSSLATWPDQNAKSLLRSTRLSIPRSSMPLWSRFFSLQSTCSVRQACSHLGALQLLVPSWHTLLQPSQDQFRHSINAWSQLSHP